MNYKQLVFEMYMNEPSSKRFRSLFNNKAINDCFDFMSQQTQVDSLIKSTELNRPALEGIIDSIEINFSKHADYDIKMNFKHRQMTGSMVRFIMGHYGYLKDKSKPLKRGSYIKTAIVYKKYE